ncbi:hypothetical protein [Brochothrix thermosphacta]|nr:hypothetical protein [Brochothrix thermosphacta]ODJ60145.1 hypothetical protein BFR44_03655 [Brochothrix thermosphacta]
MQSFLDDPNQESIIIINPSLLNEGDELFFEDDLEAIKQARLGINKYRIKSVKNSTDVKGGTKFAKAVGGPGTILSIKQTKSISTTISSKFGASAKFISGEIG